MGQAGVRLRMDDTVELIAPLAGRPKLVVGTRRRVLVEQGQSWGIVTVQFARQPRPLLLHPRHLRRVAPAARVGEATD